MLVDSLIVPECIYRPGSFTGLMTLYESNFIKLDGLVGSQLFESAEQVSRTPKDCDLHLQLLRREPYTTTLRLTYWLTDAQDRWVADPDLTLRIYHDARLVEAVAASQAHHHRMLKELARSQSRTELDRRWRSNIMLNKWLDYLLEMGHRFP